MQSILKIKLSVSIIALQVLTTSSVISGEQKMIMKKEKQEVVSKIESDKVSNSQKNTHSFGLAIENSHYHYIEPDVFQSFVNAYDRNIGARWAKTVGVLWGGSAFYRFTKHNFFIQPELRLLYGKHQYNWGAKKNIFSKTNHSIPSLIFEPRLTLGGNVHVYQGVTLSPHGGIGYRFKSDNGDDTLCNDGDKLGFYRKSNYVYVPLGASAEYQVDNTWSISLKGEYDWIVKAWHYSRTLTSGSKIFKQPNGYGLKGEVSIGYLYNKVKVSLTPYINYWNIRNSKRTYFMRNGYKSSSREPYNMTWETGLKLGASF